MSIQSTRTRAKFLSAVYLIFENEKKQTLLLRRFNTGYADGQYSLVAGHLEYGESYIQAAIREGREEAGVVIFPEDVEFAHLMHRFSDNEARISVFVKVHHWQGEIHNSEPDRCDDLSWFDQDNLPENLLDHVKDVLGMVRNGVKYSEEGWTK